MGRNRILIAGVLLSLAASARTVLAEPASADMVVLQDDVAIQIEGHTIDLVHRGDLLRRYEDRGSQSLVTRGKLGLVANETIATPQAAITFFEKELELHPDDPACFAGRAAAHFLNDQMDEAIADANEALRLAPNNPRYLVLRSWLWRKKDNIAAATADADAAIQVDEMSAYAHLERGKSLHIAKRYEEAIATFDRADNLDPDNAEILFARACTRYVFESLDVATPVMADLNRLISIDPYQSDARLLRAMVWSQSNQPQRAIDDFGMVIRLCPKKPQAYLGRGLVYSNLGEIDKALPDAEQALRLSADSFDALCLRGMIRCRSGDTAGALNDFDACLRLNPDDTGVLLFRAGVHLKDNAYDEAIADASRVISLDPDDASAFHIREEAFDAKNNSDEAARDRKRAAEIEAKTPAP